MSYVLVTGGAGYIGSHTIVELLASGRKVVALDNLSNSYVESLIRVSRIGNVVLERYVEGAPCGCSELVFVEGDIRNQSLLRLIFERFEFEAVIHFAALKAISESVAKPLMYYDNNVSGSITLLQIMAEFNCKKFVFSSSATVYGDSASVPISEDFPLSTVNPYGASKLIVEGVLRDVASTQDGWSIAVLRYFNPVGAHESGMIGEHPNGTPNNLMPYISEVAIGKRERLKIYGGDYPTHDGTGVRDYVHVVDLAKGHLRALEIITQRAGVLTVNLGRGEGHSVLDMVKAFEKASGKYVNYEIVARRSGDVAQCYTNPNFAFETLGWKAVFDLDRMCVDTWRWQKNNPEGYQS